MVGAHNVPRWYEALDRLVEAGTLSRADMADAPRRDPGGDHQEVAGIDIVTGGEMHRRTTTARTVGKHHLPAALRAELAPRRNYSSPFAVEQSRQLACELSSRSI